MVKKTILDAVALATGSQTDNNITVVDFGKQAGNTPEFLLSGKVVGNATAPGVATVTPNIYWSDEDPALVGMAVADLAAGGQHNARKSALTALTLINGVSKTTRGKFTSSPLRPEARYMILSIDKTTETGGAISTLTVYLTKLTSTAARF